MASPWSRLRRLFRPPATEPDEPPLPARGEQPLPEGFELLADPRAKVDGRILREAVEALRRSGRELRAVELLGDALRLRPDDPELTAALAEVHVRRLDFDSAAPLLELLRSSPDHATWAELSLAESAERRGELEQALVHYERILARDLDHGRARTRAEGLRARLGHTGSGPAQPTIVQPEGIRTRGRYRLERELGRGGAGAVYLATDTQLGREVALKVYHPQVMRGDGPTQLAREGALPGRLGHPGIVLVLDVDRALGAVAMELLPGGSLKDWVRTSGPRPASEALAMIEAVCAPLAAMHAAGLVHRDVKPANVLRRHDGTPVLTDLGVALLPGEEHRPGVGTPAYMAPEQQTERLLDARADVYSVGVMLAEMLGGYPGPAGRVGDLLEACLCESPTGRPKDAEELGRLARAARLAETAPPERQRDLAAVVALATAER